jgi:hypothetical protein
MQGLTPWRRRRPAKGLFIGVEVVQPAGFGARSSNLPDAGSRRDTFSAASHKLHESFERASLFASLKGSAPNERGVLSTALKRLVFEPPGRLSKAIPMAKRRDWLCQPNGLAGIYETSAIQGRLQAGLSVDYGLTGFLVAWLSGQHFLRAVPIAIPIGGLIAAGDADRKCPIGGFVTTLMVANHSTRRLDTYRPSATA